MEINNKAIIEAYNQGQSLNAIARTFGTHAITVKRILQKCDVKLRHDTLKKGTLQVQHGEELIEWAKAQGRLVAKAELAERLGRKRLSPSYFIKYPELGKYIITYTQNELQDYSQKLYNWLQKNNILYKPNDRTKLRVSVTALLLGEYSKIALQINIKPKYVSKERYEKAIKTKLRRAAANGILILWLDEKSFENLDSLKPLMDALK